MAHVWLNVMVGDNNMSVQMSAYSAKVLPNRLAKHR